MDLKDLQSSDSVIRALGDFSTELMELLHNKDGLSADDEAEIRQTLVEIHHLMARIGYTAS
jgi:hypothetical protein